VQAVSTAPFQGIAQHAKTLRWDIGAVELAITTPWVNGPIEGQINRPKAIKVRYTGVRDSSC
jgi:transposase